MKRILTSFISIALLMAGSLNAHATEARSFTLNLVEARPSASTVDLPESEGSETMHIEKRPILTQADFAHASAMSREGKAILQATLTGAGAAKLKEFSASHVGQKLAVVMGEHVLAAPVIRVAIGQKFEVDGFSREDAERLVQLINQKNVN